MSKIRWIAPLLGALVACIPLLTSANQHTPHLDSFLTIDTGNGFRLSVPSSPSRVIDNDSVLILVYSPDISITLTVTHRKDILALLDDDDMSLADFTRLVFAPAEADESGVTDEETVAKHARAMAGALLGRGQSADTLNLADIQIFHFPRKIFPGEAMERRAFVISDQAEDTQLDISALGVQEETFLRILQSLRRSD
ncbi:hypothetical protein J2T57_003702 [Natronocella acetinitrilica]|uniref:DUF1795 domain-containing protein n=1 Tax=Natronocella acetinitrilica TaxID=414046 RepID=A0AAE3G836_9GAMM|nr:hypothetical protein [Natronocella acetinitrilica]MCP1676541.1 hypothetical protein [Natronocella acetinitrilica]